jgi:hypothetical protein
MEKRRYAEPGPWHDAGFPAPWRHKRQCRTQSGKESVDILGTQCGPVGCDEHVVASVVNQRTTRCVDDEGYVRVYSIKPGPEPGDTDQPGRRRANDAANDSNAGNESRADDSLAARSRDADAAQS